jgi:hypothetical protein
VSDCPKTKQQFQQCSSKITDFLSNILTLLLSITVGIAIVVASAFFHFLDDAWHPIFAVLSRCHVIEPNLPIDSAESLLFTHSVPLLLLGAVQSILIHSKKQLRWVLLLSSVFSISLVRIFSIPLYTYYGSDLSSETTRSINWTYFFTMLSVAGLLVSGFLVSRWMGGRWQTELATVSCARAVKILIVRSTKLFALAAYMYLVVLFVADITTPPPQPAGPVPALPSGLIYSASPGPSPEISPPTKGQTVAKTANSGDFTVIARGLLFCGGLLLIPLALWALERKLVRQAKSFAS